MTRPAVTLDAVRQAHERIRSGIQRTPCPASIPLSEATGAQVFCKLDLLQRTGSFKERGARNALLLLDSAQRRRGVVAASAGNHALGLAYHGKLLDIPVTVVMPRFAPLVKMATCRRLGARVKGRPSTTRGGWPSRSPRPRGSSGCTASTTRG